jgi:hypothetical protein
MNHDAATRSLDAGLAGSRSKRAFARHFGEMLLAMLLGMFVLGGLAELIFAAAGSSLTAQSSGLQITLMGISMTGPMVLWMGYRGHEMGRNVEMAASMMVPTLIAAALAWMGVLGAGSGLAVQHTVMIPAMLAVMVWRYADYSHHT